ncbi:MAG: hypothetical protein Kow0089_24860 [Desulfobulbaceae bacterium]
MRTILLLIPTLLSLSRLGLALFFPFVEKRHWIWFVLAGGASDALDGWIARRWNLTTWQGGLIDAIADKCFVLSALATFSLAGMFSPWLLPLVLARDLTVTFIALYAAHQGAWNSFRTMGARWPGKIATILQFLLMIVLSIFPLLAMATLVSAIAASFWAAADYARRFGAALRERSGNGDHPPA